MFHATAAGRTAGPFLFVVSACAIAGCTANGPHIGLTVSDTDDGTKFTDADGGKVKPPAAPGRGRAVRAAPTPATLLVAQVDSIDAGPEGFAIETVPADSARPFTNTPPRSRRFPRTPSPTRPETAGCPPPPNSASAR